MKNKISMIIKLNYQVDLSKDSQEQVNKITNQFIKACENINLEEGVTIEFINMESS